jgi:hypothetical protein
LDETRFDTLTQVFSDGATRRTAFRLLTGGTLAGVAGWLGLRDGEAKHKHKKKRKKRGCPTYCPPTIWDPLGLCAPGPAVCCTSEEGGGFCHPGQTCCPPFPGFPDGACADPGYFCPTDVYVTFQSGGIHARQTGAARR